MKKTVAVFILIVVMLTLLSGCNGKDTEKISIYFKTKNENVLTEEVRLMEVSGKTSASDRAKFAIAQMVKGPVKEAGVALLPKETKLLKIAIENKVATVNMSEHFSMVKGTDALILRLAMVNTLCGIDGIDGIVIQVNGSPIVSETTGKEFGVLSSENIAFSTDDTVSEAEQTITLYFPEKNGSSLSAEKRRVRVQNSLSLEKTAINELLKGPKKEKLSRAISEDVKLLGIETKDNVCFVNFSSEFISKTPSGSLATTLALYSVVNTLCELDNVESVQVLVNGETGAELGNLVLDIPYEKNKELIG